MEWVRHYLDALVAKAIPSQGGEWQRGNEVSIFWRELGDRVIRREIVDRSFPPRSWTAGSPFRGSGRRWGSASCWANPGA